MESTYIYDIFLNGTTTHARIPVHLRFHKAMPGIRHTASNVTHENPSTKISYEKS